MSDHRDHPDELPGRRTGFIQDDAEIGDTEGHARRRPGDDELEIEDTEGHVRPYGVGEPDPLQIDDADDTEGHARRKW